MTDGVALVLGCAQTRSILRSEAELLAEREASDKMLQEKKVHTHLTQTSQEVDGGIEGRSEMANGFLLC